VVAVTTYNAKAVKWEHGWVTLATAIQQARDFVATMLDIDADDANIHLSVAIGGVEEDVKRAPEAARRGDRQATPGGPRPAAASEVGLSEMTVYRWLRRQRTPG